MITLIPTLELVALFVAALAVIGSAGMYAELRAHGSQLKKLKGVLSDELANREQLEADFRALFRCSQNMGKALRQRSPDLQPTIKPAPLVHGESGEDDRGEKVHKLLERGLSIEDVASICSLTQGEVEFLARFSAPRTLDTEAA